MTTGYQILEVGEQEGPSLQPEAELRSWVQVEMEAEDPDFDLEKAVCSHGFFMMAPNRWDPATRTFQRPLRLPFLSSTISVFVRIFQPRRESSSLRISVFGVDSLSLPQQQSLLVQTTDSSVFLPLALAIYRTLTPLSLTKDPCFSLSLSL